jgi:hypothetical protein
MPVLLFAALSFAAIPAMATSLAPFHMHKRVLLVFAHPSEPAYQEQAQILGTECADLAKREMVVLGISGEAVTPLRLITPRP